MGTVVAKLVKLFEKDNKGYKKEGAFKVKRDRAIVLEKTVAQYEANYIHSGLLYIVDEEATKALKQEPKKRGRKAKDAEQ